MYYYMDSNSGTYNDVTYTVTLKDATTVPPTYTVTYKDDGMNVELDFKRTSDLNFDEELRKKIGILRNSLMPSSTQRVRAPAALAAPAPKRVAKRVTSAKITNAPKKKNQTQR